MPPFAPASPYAVSKLAQEQLGLARGARRASASFVTRPFNHIGPRQAPAFAAASFARQIALHRARRRRARAAGRQPRADAATSPTCATPSARTLRSSSAGTPGVVYNVCSGRALAMQELSTAFAPTRDGAGRDVETRSRALSAPRRAARPRRPHAAHHDTGWHPAIPLEQTLDDLLDYWRDAVEREDDGSHSSRPELGRPHGPGPASLTSARCPPVSAVHLTPL